VRWLDAYVNPAISDIAVGDVQPGNVLAIIKGRVHNPGTAERIRVSSRLVYNDAIRNLLVTTDPARPLSNAIARPSVQQYKHLNEKQLFKRIDFGMPDFSPRGLRSTAATLLREHGFGRDVLELLLAHSAKNATVAAYGPIELAAERRRALQFVADRVDAFGAVASVVPLRAA
jgi:integrase